ncbi:MAG TPA: M3 family metallopeptidase [Steroidobacteraceae bacterium]|nr:M3 family metallopeptidase [Steroidobacteraceae bacterium]
MTSPPEALTADNPFAGPSPLAYDLPPFDRIRESHYRPAFFAGMAEQRAEIERIARDSAPPSLQNTVVALERSGRMLERVSSVFFNLTQSNATEALLQLESEIAPQLTGHRDAMYMDETLFARIDALHATRAQLGLDAESHQLLERYHVAFVRSGARLPAPDKTRLRALNAEIASLRTRFRQHVLKATRDAAIEVDSAEQLRGLSQAQLGAAAEAARARGLCGRWLISLQNTTTQPALAQLQDRALRRRIHQASASRGHGGGTDNTAIIVRLARLRAERARLLGYANHAAYVLADENAGSPAAVERMLQQVAAAALARARAQALDIQSAIDAEAAAEGRESFRLQPWDWHYYAERQRQSRFQFDSAAVKPYFELGRVLTDGLFHVARELYGLRFVARTDLPVYQPDVRVYEVFDADGTALGLFLTDYYARDNKQGGAWMSNFVPQSHLLGQRPVVINSLNIPRPAPGEPTLLTFEELVTPFHEFGHALHGLLSDVRYPLLSGTSVPRDFVEYPSQFHEMWAREPAVLARCARHYHSGEPLPDALLERIVAAQKFDQGYLTTEYLEAALIDQAWHQLGGEQTPEAAQVMDFEAAALARRGVDCAAVPPRYHSPYFLHVFAEDYSAGYYAYLWSEVLARDTGHWFRAHGGLTRANGERLRAAVLSRGWSGDTQKLFRDFYGGPPDIGPLLEYRGLAP